MEAMYGGAAGGGKSDALLMAALQYVDYPGYAALILRRTFADLSLPGALLDRARMWLTGKNCQWDGKNKTWIFPSGSTLSFGFLEHTGDQYRYQGSEYQFIGFDECTQFEEYQYRYLFSRLRRLVGAPFTPRMRAASNPGGVGHEWVKQRFIVEGQEKGRVFVPARLTDNPHIDQESYAIALDELDPITRAQLLLGDWDARHGGSIFDRSWFDKVDTWPGDMRLVRYWDLAASNEDFNDPDYAVGTLMGMTREKQYYVLHVERGRGSPEYVEDLVKRTAIRDGKSVSIRIEQEPGSAGVSLIDHYIRRVLNGYSVAGDRSTGKNKKQMRAAPVSAQAQRRNIKVVRAPWNTVWMDELEAFPEGKHDDQVDSLSGAFNALQAGGWWSDSKVLGWLSARMQRQPEHGIQVGELDIHTPDGWPDSDFRIGEIIESAAPQVVGLAAPQARQIFVLPEGGAAR